MPAPMVAPATPASEIREFAVTRVISLGSRRGTAEARVTPYALDATRQPRAAGYSHAELLPANDAARLHTRNPRNPSVGPINGAINANGAIVSNRNNATRFRACSLGTAKNTVPASDTANAVSPAALTAPSSISR